MLVCCALVLPACGSTPPASAPEVERSLPPGVVRERWSKLANDEIDLALDLDAIAIAAPEAKLTLLQPMRANAGMLISGITRLNPPQELASCQQAALGGAKSVRATLDTINELWMQRLPRAENPREQADALVADLCDGFSRMRRARDECGVRSAADARGPRPKSVTCAEN